MTEQPHRRRIVLALAAVAALVVGAVVSWNALASADARRDIDAIPRSFTCDGVVVPYEIVHGDGAESGSTPQPAFVVPTEAFTKPDALCTLELTLVNQGSRDVTIEGVRFPRLGVTRLSGFPLELGAHGANFPASSPDDKGSAVVNVHQPLDGGDTLDLTFDLRARESATLVPGRLTWVDMLPQIEFSYRGFTRTSNGSVGIAVKG